MELNEYQKQAMTTCTATSDNLAYMLLNLIGEVGEFSSKVAKSIRKGDAKFIGNELRHPSTRRIDDELEESMQKEAGDILWQLSGVCSVMGWELDSIAQMNLDKLQSRKERGVIIGDGDKR